MAGALTQGAGHGAAGAALAALRSQVSCLETSSAGVGNAAQLKTFQTSEGKLRQCSLRLHRGDPDSTSIRADGDARVLAAVTLAPVQHTSFRDFQRRGTNRQRGPTRRSIRELERRCAWQERQLTALEQTRLALVEEVDREAAAKLALARELTVMSRVAIAPSHD